MDPPPEYLGYDTDQTMHRRVPPTNSTNLYDDTSIPPQQPGQPQQFFPGQQFIQDPAMANMAMAYGQSFAASGKDMVEKKLDHYLSVSKLKYYFAVDTPYVMKKLGLIMFPYAHTDWSLKFDKSEPVAPRYEINAPDLYIPSMAFVTYILLWGYIQGTQNKFNPEQLGMQASSVLGWLLVELFLIVIGTYIIGINAGVKYLDLLSILGYKYVGMIAIGLGLLFFSSFGYFAVLCYSGFSIAFYVVRSLKLLITPDTGASAHGNKRRMYILLAIAGLQPLFMYFLTRSLNIAEEVAVKAS